MEHPKCLHVAIALVAICSSLYANAKDVKVTSPNGKISVLITDAGDRLCYSASLDGEKLFTQTSLMVKLQNKSIGAKTRIKSVKISSVNEELRPTVPLKQANIPNNYTKATLSMRERYSIEFRVFNNAVAYRFILNERDSINIVDETFNLKPADEMAVHFQPTGGWGTGSESPYISCMLNEWKYEHDMSVLPMALSSTKRDLHLRCLLYYGNGYSQCPCARP